MEIQQTEIPFNEKNKTKNKPKTSLDSLLNSGKAKTLRFSMVPVTPQIKPEFENGGEHSFEKTQ
jgi:hypothetical protein